MIPLLAVMGSSGIDAITSKINIFIGSNSSEI